MARLSHGAWQAACWQHGRDRADKGQSGGGKFWMLPPPGLTNRQDHLAGYFSAEPQDEQETSCSCALDCQGALEPAVENYPSGLKDLLH